MNELALFAGAGGGILGGKLLGWRTVCAVEWDAYAASVLIARQNDGILPPFPIWDDVRTFDGAAWRGRVDVVSGGFPCQDISCAGLGAGIYGSSGSMWFQMSRIIREVQPEYAFVENSPMLARRGLGRVIADLASMGYDARWGVFGGVDAGAPHKRERMWIVAHSKRNQRRVEEEPCGRTIGRMGWGKKQVPWNEPCESALSRLRGVDDGLAGSVDRTDCIRNGQIPAVAALAWGLLSQGD